VTPDAYDQLARWGLPHPRLYAPLDVLSGQFALTEREVYVRRKDDPSASGFINVEDVCRNPTQFRVLLAQDRVAQIEAGIRSTLGGCLVTDEMDTYGEVCIGHLSGLLRRGWCAVRFRGNKTRYVRRAVTQPRMVVQKGPANSIVDATTLESSMETTVIHSVLEKSQSVPPRTLLEFIVSVDGEAYFVDYKAYPWEVRFGALLEEAEVPVVIYGTQRKLPERVYRGTFELQALDRARRVSAVSVAGRAVLSHFVTYLLREGPVSLVLE